MIQTNTGITEYLSRIKKTDEIKLKNRRIKDKEVFIVNEK